MLPVCVCGNVQGNCGGRLLIKFGKYLFRSCNRAARQAGKKGTMGWQRGKGTQDEDERGRVCSHSGSFAGISIGRLSLWRAGYFFCSFVWPVGKRLNLESLKVVTLPRQIHYYLLSVS